MEAGKAKNIRIIIAGATIIAALMIFSLTFGRDLVEGRNLTIHSFAILHFSGYLFFLLMPVELAFIYCVSNGYNLVLLVGIAYGTAIAAQMVDYLLGYSVSKKVLDTFVNPKKHARAIRLINKYGWLAIFIFNVFPLSSPIICLASGMIKFPFKKVVLISSLGLLIKYTVIGLVVVL